MSRAEITYVDLEAKYVPGAAAVELAAFPTADPEDLLSEEDLYAYCETFPEGAFVALDGDRVVGLGTGIFIDFDFDHIQHTISEVSGEHQCGNHRSDGDWYYGTDITVLSDYRGYGIGRRLYELRKDVVRRFNRRGIIAGGHLPGYAEHRHLAIEDYVASVVAGDLYDPTLTFQLRNGFEVRGIINDYIEDPAIDNKSSLIVWDNPDYQPPSQQGTVMSEPSIRLVTDLPGPKSVAINVRRDASMPTGAARLTQVAIVAGSGAVVTDVDGNQLLDWAGGIGMLAVGHGAEPVVKAIADQASSLIAMCNIVATTEPSVELAETLNRLTPGDFDKKTLLMNSGAEAVEGAISMSRAHTGRAGVLVFEGAFHGRTNLTMAMTSKYGLFKKGFGPFAPEIYRIGFPNPYRTPEGMSEKAWVEWHCSNLRQSLITQIDPSALAAIVIEPVQGEGGFLPAPPEFLAEIRSICDQFGIVMIADEIQSGSGRTGKLFAIEHSGVVPDMITSGKSLGAGMPISAITGRTKILDAPHPGGLGGTYSGSPVASVAAIEALKILTDPAFADRSVEVGRRLRSGFESIQEDHPDRVGDVRGLGPMLVMEIVADSVSKEPDMDATAAICAAAVARGLIIIRAGMFSNCVRFLPPLNMTDAQIDEGLAVLRLAVDEVLSA